MSYTYRIGRAVTEHAVGKPWTFGRFTRNVWVELAEEARRLLPDPIAVALDAIAEATKRDAEILREMYIKDAADEERAAIEGRRAVLLAPMYKPMSADLCERAYASARRYLSAASPELSTFMMSHEGCSFLFWRLLLPHHPGIELEQAFDVYWDLATNPMDDAGKTIDGRMSIHQIITSCNGQLPEPAKNGESPV